MSNRARAGARKAACVTSLGMRVYVCVCVYVCTYTYISGILPPPSRSLPRSIAVANRDQYHRRCYYCRGINAGVAESVRYRSPTARSKIEQIVR